MPVKLLKATKPNEYIHIAGYKTELNDNSISYVFFAVDNFSYFGLDAKSYNDGGFDTYLGFINTVLQREELKGHFDKSGKTTLVIDLNNKFTRKLQKLVPKHVKIICDKKLARSVTNKLFKAIFKD
jgi:hypothetical protein